MIRMVPQIAVTFVTGAEKTVLKAYQDPSGNWTIGTGHTGREVVAGLTITADQALIELRADLAIAAGRLAQRVNDAAILGLTDHEYAALLSFVFNLGAGAGWTIWKLLNAGQLDQVPAQMLRFDKEEIGGKLVAVAGLDHRRMAEVALWKAPDVAAAVAIVQAAPVAPPPSSYTRAASTPPTAAVVTPLHKSGTFVASAASAAAAVGGVGLPLVQQAATGVKSVSEAITPYADASTLIAKVIHVLVLIAAGLAVATLACVWLKHRAAKAA